METSTSIAVVGHICLDITPKILGTDDRSLIPGALYPCHGVDISLGGATANTGLALAKLGNTQVEIVARVGNDYFGSTISHMLDDAEGIHHWLSRDEQVATSYSVIIAKKGIDRIIFHDSGANNTFRTDAIPFHAMQSVSLVHFGYPPMMQAMIANNGKELIHMFTMFKRQGATTSLDMCMPKVEDVDSHFWADLLTSVLPCVDVFIPSVEELLFMVDRSRYEAIHSTVGMDDFVNAVSLADLQRLGDFCIARKVGIVAIKCGKRGYYARSASAERLLGMGKGKPENLSNWQNRELFVSSVCVDRVVSTTGAGDASIAGFLQALCEGESIEDTVAMACTVGSISTQSFDSVSALVPYASMRQRLHTQQYNSLPKCEDHWKGESYLMFGPNDGRENNL